MQMRFRLGDPRLPEVLIFFSFQKPQAQRGAENQGWGLGTLKWGPQVLRKNPSLPQTSRQSNRCDLRLAF